MSISLVHYPKFKLPGLLPRDVWVWTPPQYHAQPDARFPVIYMHDGQNLFIPERSYTSVTWGVAETISKLSCFGFIQPAIVVGIDNTPNRMGDYLPTRPFETPEGKAFVAKLKAEAAEELERIDFVADRYLELIVKKIKPRIDQNFRTHPEREHTLVMGSSMGGLISLYALVENPGVFGKAGCFSTHWPVLGDFTAPYLRKFLPEAGHHHLYFDYGTGEGDRQYSPYQATGDNIIRKKGYHFGQDWLTRVAPGAVHHEKAWRSRFHLALRFLLGT